MTYVEPDPPPIGSFESQFERDGDGWLYRRAMRGPAIRVSDGERRDLITAYGQARDRELVMLLGGGIAVVVAPLPWPTHGDSLPWIAWLVGGSIVAAIVLAHNWRGRGAPERQLGLRDQVAPARSREEVTRLRLSRTSWLRLLQPALLPTVLFALNGPRLFKSGFAIFWEVGLAATLLLTLVDVVRKWRFQA